MSSSFQEPIMRAKTTQELATFLREGTDLECDMALHELFRRSSLFDRKLDDDIKFWAPDTSERGH